jgi:hypothetical protein
MRGARAEEVNEPVTPLGNPPGKARPAPRSLSQETCLAANVEAPRGEGEGIDPHRTHIPG